MKIRLNRFHGTKTERPAGGHYEGQVTVIWTWRKCQWRYKGLPGYVIRADHAATVRLPSAPLQDYADGTITVVYQTDFTPL